MGASRINIFPYCMGRPQTCFFAYCMGAPSDQFLCLLYGAPLDQFLRLLYGVPFRSVSLLIIWGPLRSVSSHITLVVACQRYLCPNVISMTMNVFIFRNLSSKTVFIEPYVKINYSSSLSLCGAPLGTVSSHTI